MQLIYNINNISLGRCADMLENNNYKLISILPLPKRYLQKKYINFCIEFESMLFESESSDYISDEWSKIIFYNKAANVLPLLFLGIKYNAGSEYIDYFEKYYGKYPGKENALDRINLAIVTINKRIEELNLKSEKTEEKFSLWALILQVEFILDRPIDINIRIATFKRYLTQAIKKNKDGRKN